MLIKCCFQIQKLRLYLSFAKEAEIDFHILYTLLYANGLTAPLRKAEN